MTELDKIISEMNPELFTDNPGGPVNLTSAGEPEQKTKLYMEDKYGNEAIIHQEVIPNDLARALLLPNQYDDYCSYQVITMVDSTILLRIDDRIPIENDNLPDNEENPVRRHITEFPLDSTGDVQSYTEMVQDILNPKPLPSMVTYRSELLYEEKSQHHWWLTPLIVFLSLLACGCGLLYFVINYL